MGCHRHGESLTLQLAHTKSHLLFPQPKVATFPQTDCTPALDTAKRKQRHLLRSQNTESRAGVVDRFFPAGQLSAETGSF